MQTFSIRPGLFLETPEMTRARLGKDGYEDYTKDLARRAARPKLAWAGYLGLAALAAAGVWWWRKKR